ncbi:MAG: ABC transporter permease subunit [Candidatus Dormibacteraeota bacterium]|nr:ABC transporter permease subunit [Candidatus Dormibacteraeota bacterium]MBO0744516.1 ABC transporter permease subunit [Candidatus Dormibacteraeota bacterium]
MLRREVWLLVGKELRQLTRNRNAAVSAVLMPLIFLILVPLIQLGAAGSRASGGGISGTPLAGLNSIGNTDQVFLYLIFPLFYTLCGLLTPGISATYTIVAEREQHTVELLMALPVTVRQILIAKLSSNLIAAAAVSLPFFVVNAIMVQTRTGAGAAYIVSALVLLLCGLACSVGIGLLLALIARDVRTAGNLTPLWLFPTMALTGLVVVLVPGLWRFYVLGAILLLGLAATLAVCLRWLTFERFVA